MKRLLVAAMVLFAAGCCGDQTKTDHKEDVVRVFMHEPGCYSVLTKDLKAVSFRNMVSDNEGCRLIADVPQDKPMWYEGTYKKSDGCSNGWASVRIHIHAGQDVNGGGWRTGGKFPKDVGTIPVE